MESERKIDGFYFKTNVSVDQKSMESSKPSTKPKATNVSKKKPAPKAPVSQADNLRKAEEKFIEEPMYATVLPRDKRKSATGSKAGLERKDEHDGRKSRNFDLSASRKRSSSSSSTSSSSSEANSVKEIRKSSPIEVSGPIERKEMHMAYAVNPPKENIKFETTTLKTDLKVTTKSEEQTKYEFSSTKSEVKTSTKLPETQKQSNISASSSSSLDSRKLESTTNKGAIAKSDVKIETSKSKPKKNENKQNTKHEKKSLLSTVKEKLDSKRHHKQQPESTNVRKTSIDKPKDAHRPFAAKLHYKSASKENSGGLKFTQQEYEQFYMESRKNDGKSDTSDDEGKNKQSKKRFRDHFTSKATKEKEVKVKPPSISNSNELSKPKLGSIEKMSSQELLGNYEKIDTSKAIPSASITVSQNILASTSSKTKKVDVKKSNDGSSTSKNPKTKHHKRVGEEIDSSSEDSSTVAEKIKQFFHRTNEEIKQISKPSEKNIKKTTTKAETAIVVKPVVDSKDHVQESTKESSFSDSSSSDSEKNVSIKIKSDKPTQKIVPEKPDTVIKLTKPVATKDLEPHRNPPEKPRKNSSSSDDKSKKDKGKPVTLIKLTKPVATKDLEPYRNPPEKPRKDSSSSDDKSKKNKGKPVTVIKLTKPVATKDLEPHRNPPEKTRKDSSSSDDKSKKDKGKPVTVIKLTKPVATRDLETHRNQAEKPRKDSSSSDDESKKNKDQNSTVNIKTPQYKIYSNELPTTATNKPTGRRHSSSSSDSSSESKNSTSKNVLASIIAANTSKSSDEAIHSVPFRQTNYNYPEFRLVSLQSKEPIVNTGPSKFLFTQKSKSSFELDTVEKEEKKYLNLTIKKDSDSSDSEKKRSKVNSVPMIPKSRKSSSSSSSDDKKKGNLKGVLSNTIKRKDSSSSEEKMKFNAKVSLPSIQSSQKEKDGANENKFQGNISVPFAAKTHSDSSSSDEGKKQKGKISVTLNPIRRRGSKISDEEKKNKEKTAVSQVPKIDKESSSSEDDHGTKTKISKIPVPWVDTTLKGTNEKKTTTYTISFPPLPKIRKESTSSEEEKKKRSHNSSDSDKEKRSQPFSVPPKLNVEQKNANQLHRSPYKNDSQESNSSDDEQKKKETVCTSKFPNIHKDSSSSDEEKKKSITKLPHPPTTIIGEVQTSTDKDKNVKDTILLSFHAKIDRDTSSSDEEKKNKKSSTPLSVVKVEKASSSSEEGKKQKNSSIAKPRKNSTSSSDEKSKKTIITTSKSQGEIIIPVKEKSIGPIAVLTKLRRSSSSSDEDKRPITVTTHTKPSNGVDSNTLYITKNNESVVSKPSIPKQLKSSSSSSDEGKIKAGIALTTPRLDAKIVPEKDKKSNDKKPFSILSKLRRDSSSSEDEIKNKSKHTSSPSRESKVEISTDDKKNQHSFSIPSLFQKRKDSSSSDEETHGRKVDTSKNVPTLHPEKDRKNKQEISFSSLSKSKNDSSSSDESIKQREKILKASKDSSDSDKSKKNKQPIKEPVTIKVNMSTIGHGSSDSSDDGQERKNQFQATASPNKSNITDQTRDTKTMMKWKSSEFLDRFRKHSDSSDEEKKISKKDSSPLVVGVSNSSSKPTDTEKNIELKNKTESSNRKKSASSESSDDEERKDRNVVNRLQKSSESSDEKRTKSTKLLNRKRSSSSEDSKNIERTFVIVPQTVTPTPMKRTLSSDILSKTPNTNINQRKSGDSSDDSENNFFGEIKKKLHWKAHEKPEKYKVHKVTHVTTKKSNTSSSSTSDSSDDDKKNAMEAMKPPVPKERNKSHGQTKDVSHSKKPSWINESFIEISLRKQFGADIKVTNLHVEPAVGKGENYACDVFRTRVYTKTKIVHLILKCLPESELRAKLMQESKIAQREILVYNHALPLLRGDLDTPKYPLCYYTYQDGTQDTLVLQDMKPLGYESAPRTKGLDVEHCRLALTELAHLHGLSAAMRKLAPDVFASQLIAKYPEVMYRGERKQIMAPFIKHAMSGVSKAILTHLPMRYHFAGHILEDISDDVFDVLKRCVSYKQGHTVFNHGDYWSNNMLFRYAKGSIHPLACSMIDFQIARCVPAVFDLLYFFFTSTEQEVRKSHLKELLKLYLNEAHWIMQLQGVENPAGGFYVSMEEIEADMKKHAIFGFLSTCLSMPVIVANQDDIPDMDDYKEEDMATLNPFEKMYSSQAFCRRMRHVIEDFDDMGLFDDIVHGKIYK